MTHDMNDKDIEALLDRAKQATGVPEPSPLFWDHFPGRVRAAVNEQERAPIAWWRRPIAAFAALMIVAGGAMVATRIQLREHAERDARNAAVLQTEPAPQADDAAALQLADDETWDVVTDVATSAGPAMVADAGFGVKPGDAGAAIEALDASERARLVALLQAEMKGDDAGGL